MKTWCPQGTMYTEMDALLACAEALVRGATVNGVHECSDCGTWHVGQRKQRWETCQAARKRIFTKQEAKKILRKALRAKKNGDTRRTEIAIYECKLSHGCGRWHLTSMEQNE